MTIVLTAYVRGSPDSTPPIAVARFRSHSLAEDTRKLWRKDFRISIHEETDDQETL